jgi:hypothetical protein
MKRFTKKSKPKGNSWKTAKLFDADLYISRLPICGGRMVWAVVGWKRVRCCEAFSNIKFSLSRKEWDSTAVKERV